MKRKKLHIKPGIRGTRGIRGQRRKNLTFLDVIKRDEGTTDLVIHAITRDLLAGSLNIHCLPLPASVYYLSAQILNSSREEFVFLSQRPQKVIPTRVNTVNSIVVMDT